MERKIKFLIITISTIAIFLAGLFAVSISQIYLFTSDAEVVEVENNEDASIWKVYDGQTLLGEIYFKIEPNESGLDQNRMTISFTLFQNQTELDSIELKFSGGNNVVSVYREASSYDWKYKFYTQSGDVLFEVLDLAWFGQSTTKLDFMLFPFDAANLYLSIQVSMHRIAPLQLTSLKAQVFIDAPIPQINA